MIEIFSILVNGIWRILSYDITFDQWTFKIWYVFAFVIILASLFKILIVEKGGKPQ